MPDTTNRPTPEEACHSPQVACSADRPTPNHLAIFVDQAQQRFNTSYGASALLDALAEHGYVIVHPDDVPEGRYMFTTAGFVDSDGEDHREGWNACRAHIFGDDQ